MGLQFGLSRRKGLFMRRFIHSIAATVISLLLPACVTRGHDFSSDISWIKAQKTTQADVTAILGAPEKVGNSGGTPTWTYGFYDWSLFGDSYTKEVKLYWNDDRTVKDFAFTSSFPEDRKKDLYLQQKI